MKKIAFTLLLAGFTHLSADGQTLFNKCVQCHGQNAEKSALGTSQVIAGWSKNKLINALNKYKLDKKYGGAMAIIMQEQVKNLDDNQIELLANFISTK